MVVSRGWRSVLAAVVTVVLCGTMLTVATTAASAATVDPAAWYVLVNRNSGKAMDVCGVSTADGACIQQYTRHDGNNQQFQFVDSGGGFYRLRARHSGKVLDVYNWSTANGAAIVQWTDHNGANQQFRLADSPDGYVRLINRNSGKAAEVQGASTANGARVVQNTDSGGANQQWQLIPIGGGGGGGNLPSTFRWSSSGMLAGPRPDASPQQRGGYQGLLRRPAQQPVADLRDDGEPVPGLGPGSFRLR